MILHEAEPVHVEAERGLDARDVKHRAWEPVGDGVDATTPPACAETAGDTWHHRTTVDSRILDLAAGEVDGRTFATGC